nr:hypothetical protein [Candidatus Sigynarchaeota archaeon]
MCLPTGTGKTRVQVHLHAARMIEMCEQPKPENGVFVIAAHRLALCTQLLEDFVKVSVSSGIPFDILYEGRKKFKEAMATGADGLVSYCGGCIYLLWAAKELFDVDIDVYHVFEIVRMAAGEKLDYPRQHEKRAWDIIAIITYQLAVSLLQRPFPITKLSYDKERSTFTPRNVFALKAIRLLFNSGLVRGVYRKMFSVLMNLLKTRK